MGTSPPGALEKARRRKGSKIVSVEIDHGATADEFEKRAADLNEQARSGGSGRFTGIENLLAGAGVYAQLAISHRLAQLVEQGEPQVLAVEEKP